MKVKMANEKLIVVSLFTLSILFLCKIPLCSFASGDDDKYNKGVTVSPSHIKFNVDIGKIKTKNIKVSNFTSKTQKFKVVYNDFDISNDGKSSFMDAGSSNYSLSKLINISPTFLEIEPGGSKDVTITVSVPADPEANKAAWGVILIEQVEEKKVLDPGNTSGETVAFGITPTYAFGVWLYQNPPHVENMNVDITNFLYTKKDFSNVLFLNVKNQGDGISFCNAYVELTNLNNGSQNILGGKRYTILPGYERSFIFELPEQLQKGNYSAVGVLDYNSDSEIVAAELEFNVD